MLVTAVYIRVSTTSQNEAGQRREVQKWLDGHGIDNVAWYVDRETGDHLERPEFARLQSAIFAGSIKTVVVWKLDRLSRKMRDGVNTLCNWCDQGLRVVSVTQQIDFSGAAGKLIASVLFAVAEMEQETRRERQAAGIAAAKEQGKTWGGSKKGRLINTTKEQVQAVLRMHSEGAAITEIARTVSLSRPTIYRLLDQAGVDRPASRRTS